MQTGFNVYYLTSDAYKRFEELRSHDSEVTYLYDKEEQDNLRMNILAINGTFISNEGSIEDTESDIKKNF